MRRSEVLALSSDDLPAMAIKPDHSTSKTTHDYGSMRLKQALGPADG